MNVRRLVLGGALLALGVLVGVVGLVWAFRSFFDIEAAVPLDGEPHVVDVGAGEHFVWVDTSLPEPSCEVQSGGTTLPLRPVSGTFTRSSGSAGPWEARWILDAPSSRVSITCAGAEASDSDAVEIGPRIEGFGLVGRLLGTIGLVVPDLALLLSVVAPGSGHLYLGVEPAKRNIAFALLGATVAAVVLAYFSFILFVIGFVVWAGAAFYAVKDLSGGDVAGAQKTSIPQQFVGILLVGAGALLASLLFPLLLVPHLGLVRSCFLFGILNCAVGLAALPAFAQTKVTLGADLLYLQPMLVVPHY